MTREAWRYAAATICGSVVWILPHIRNLGQVPDRGDPIFSAWRLATFARQLFTDPVRLFDGNIFYPLPLTLTYSDPTVLQGALGAPFIVSGINPLIVSNALFLIAFPLCGLAFFYAAWRLTGDARAGLVSGLIGAWYPFHGEHYSHLELQWFMFVPLAFVGVLRALADPRWQSGLAAGAAIGAQWLASMYIGLMLATVLVVFALVVALGWRLRPSRRLTESVVAAATIALPAFLLTGVPYLMSREARGDRSAREVMEGSARLSDYASTHRRLAAYQWHSRADNVAERELFPGTLPLVLGAAGAWPPITTVTAALAVSGATAIEWSRGLNGWTYPAIYNKVPAYRGIRVPARFSVILGSVLALLCAFGTHRLLDRIGSARGRTAAASVLAGLVLVDLRLTTSLVNYWPTVPSIYQRVTPDMVLAELPASQDIHYMYFSTDHRARLIGGYSGFIPKDPTFGDALMAFPAPAAIEAFQQRGATHLSYNCAFERSLTRCEYNLAQLGANPRLELVASERWLNADVRLYRIR
jgi:hypothetical protein